MEIADTSGEASSECAARVATLANEVYAILTALILRPAKRALEKHPQEFCAVDALAGLFSQIAVTDALTQIGTKDAFSDEPGFKQALGIWDDYLATHPNDGQAIAARGAALHRLGREIEARSAAGKACALGVKESCAHTGN